MFSSYDALVTEHRTAAAAFELAEKAWLYEVWVTATARGRIKSSDEMIEKEIGRAQLVYLSDEYVMLEILDGSRRQAVKDAQEAVYNAKRNLQQFEDGLWSDVCGDVWDLTKVDWNDICYVACRMTSPLSDALKRLGNRAPQEPDALQDLQDSTNQVIGVVKDTVKRLDSRDFDDPTLRSFFENAAAIDWKTALENCIKAQNVAYWIEQQKPGQPVSEWKQELAEILSWILSELNISRPGR